jgi:hypothetical protein
MSITLNDFQVVGLETLKVRGVDFCAYKWLFNKKIFGKPILISYKDFMDWYFKKSKGKASTSERTASRAFHRLAKKGLAEVKSRGSGMFEITLFDLNVALGLSCPDSPKMASEEKRQDVEPVKPKTQCEVKKRVLQQQLIEAKKLLSQIGVNYRLEKDWWEIVGHGLEAIEETVNYFKYKIFKKPDCIYNPAGWVRDCLKYGYWLDFNESITVYGNLIDGLMAIAT